jgi:GNAT superfamily N-acetyltransferase
MIEKNNVIIRKAIEEDCSLLAEIGKETFIDTFGCDNTEEDMKNYLSKTYSPEIQLFQIKDMNNFFLLIFHNNIPIGFSRLVQGKSPECISCQKPIEISKFYIRKPWIGEGFSAYLMKETILEAKKHGSDKIWLDVWEKNPRAIAFYKKWNFEIVGNQEFRLGDDIQNDLIMARSC